MRQVQEQWVLLAFQQFDEQAHFEPRSLDDPTVSNRLVFLVFEKSTLLNELHHSLPGKIIKLYSAFTCPMVPTLMKSEIIGGSSHLSFRHPLPMTV